MYALEKHIIPSMSPPKWGTHFWSSIWLAQNKNLLRKQTFPLSEWFHLSYWLTFYLMTIAVNKIIYQQLPNEMQNRAVYLLFRRFTLHVSGVNYTHYQEYTKLWLQPPVLVIFCVQLPPSNMAKLAWPRWREAAAHKIWPVPEAVVTVLCTPDDGFCWHPKHVEWTCRIINRLLCVASRWTNIGIDQRYTEL